MVQQAKKALPVAKIPLSSTSATTSDTIAHPSKSLATATSSSKKSATATVVTKNIRQAPPAVPVRTLPLGRGGVTAVRGGLRNVFSLRSASKRPRPNLLANSSDTAKAPKLYANKSLERKAVLQGRERADAAPDISRLGGLYDPSRPDQYRAMRPTITIKPILENSFESQQNDFRSTPGLFVSPQDSQATDNEASDSSPAWEQGHPDSQMRHETCYYWHKNQQGSGIKCSKGNYCFYYHQYKPNMPIAAAPPADVAQAKTRFTCYFWHTGQTDTRVHCNKESCLHLHGYEDGVPILGPPQYYKPPPPLEESVRPDSRYTCFFWHLEQIDNNFHCHNNPCWNIHGYEEGIPVKPPPREFDFPPGLEALSQVNQRRLFVAQAPPQPPPQPPPQAAPQAAPQPFPRQTRPEWDPHEPLNAICWHWANGDQCTKSDSNCKYYHSNDARIPFAPSRKEQGKIFEMTPCKFFFKYNDCKWGPICKYSHVNQTQSGAERNEMAQLDSPYINDNQFTSSDYFSGANKNFSTHPGSAHAPTNIENGSSISKPTKKAPKKTVSFDDSATETRIPPSLAKLAKARTEEEVIRLGSGDAEPTRQTVDANMIRRGDLKKIIPPGYWKTRPEGSRLMIPNFFLFFPPGGKAAADSLVASIKTTHPNSNFSDSEDPKSWEKFIRNSEKCGIVLVYQDRFLHLLQFPHLFGALNSGSFTFWFISDNKPPKRLPFTSSHFLHDPESMTAGTITATRLLPHGAAILLTPSFLVAEPEQTYRVLRWFLGSTREKNAKYHPKHLSTTVGTWKLVVCHDFIKYYERLGHCKVREKERYEALYKDNPAKEAKLEALRLSYAKCDLRFRTLLLLSDFENRRYEINPLTANFHRTGDSVDNAHPIVLVPPQIDPNDEKAVVSWFGAWSTSKLDMHRKFFVLGTGSSSQKYASRLPWVPRKEYDAQLSTYEAADLAANQIDEDQAPSTDKRASTITGAKSTEAVSLGTSSKVSFALPSNPSTKPGSNNENSNPKDAQKQRALAIAAKLSVSSPLKATTNSNTTAKNTSGIAPSEASADELESEILDMIQKESSRSTTSNQLPPLRTTVPATMSASPSPAILFLDNTSRRGSLVQSAGPLDSFSPQFNAPDSRPGSAMSTSSSNTSQAGIASDQNGNRFVPRSVRFDDSIRKEKAVWPGFVPKEDDTGKYKIPARRESADLSRSQESSRRGSLAGIGAGIGSAMPVVSDADLMDIDVDVPATAIEDVDRMDIDINVDTDNGKTKLDGRKRKLREKVKLTGMIHYKPTTDWWKRAREEGDKRFAWEHLFVDRWESVFKMLNIDSGKPIPAEW